MVPDGKPIEDGIDSRERVGDNFSDPASIDAEINFNDNDRPECRERGSTTVLYLPRDFIATNCRYIPPLVV